MAVQQGQFVEVRGRPWLVEAVDDREPSLTTLRLSCIADDTQGEQIEVIWDAEIGAKVIQDDTWSQVGRGTADSPEVLAAYLHAIRWRSRQPIVTCRNLPFEPASGLQLLPFKSRCWGRPSPAARQWRASRGRIAAPAPSCLVPNAG